MGNILIIPDVHGRSFWKEAVRRHPDADTIFLGDYHDPYPQEEITEEESLDNFSEIVDYARSHPNCHLLLGNHDLHYLCNFGEACRMDYTRSAVIHGLLYDNLDLFDIVTVRQIEDKVVVFSHAPILSGWIETVNVTDDAGTLAAHLNSLLSTITMDPWEAESYLGYISEFRGGFDTVGSPVWADVREITGDELIPTTDYCIFGHTQVPDAIITHRWANLDCRRAFLLSPDLRISNA